MAKSGFLFHRKNRNLSRALERELGQPVMLTWSLGVCDALWDAISKRRPRGDIGALTDQAIADEIDWTGKAEQLIRALVAAEVLLEHPDHRLVASGWSEHCPDHVRKRLARAGEQFWDGTPPFKRAAAEGEGTPQTNAPAACPPTPSRVPPAADHDQTPANHGTPPAAVGSLPSLAKPSRTKPSQAKPKAGAVGGSPRPVAAPPARPPSLADAIDHDPDDPDQRRLAERLAGIERQLAAAEGREPSPRELRGLLSSLSAPPGGDPLDSLRRASPEWIAVTYAHCGRFERDHDLRSPEDLADDWIASRNGLPVVAVGVQAWLATHQRGEPLAVALERWAMEPSEDEIPPGGVDQLNAYLSRPGPAQGLRATG